MDIIDLIDRLAELPDALILGLVTLGSFVEYIFPPAPADSLTLSASILASRSGTPWWFIGLCGTVGSVMGSIVAWYVGHWIVRSGRLSRLSPSHQRSIQRVLEAFEKHGPIWLCTNRFLPGLRAFFFIAAAMAGIPLRVSTFWAAISAAAWSFMLVGLGVTLARNLEELLMWVQRIQITGALIVAAIVFFGVRYYLGIRKKELAAEAANASPDDDLPSADDTP